MVLASRYAAKLRSEAEKMKKNLTLLSAVVEGWVQLQNTWIYMENIFGSGGDIKQLLYNEAGMFQGVNKLWEGLMQDVTKLTYAKNILHKRKKLD